MDAKVKHDRASVAIVFIALENDDDICQMRQGLGRMDMVVIIMLPASTTQ